MSSQSVQPLEQAKPATQKVYTSEIVFKYVNMFLVFILLFCIRGFLNFREFCISKDMYVLPVDSFLWTLVGFSTIAVTKYLWMHFMEDKIGKIVHPRYEGNERTRKLQSMLRTSYGTIVYIVSTFLAYSLFRKEYWFPSMVGGCGACSEIYKQFPNWPSTGRENLEMYFMIQLGVHGFALFEIIVIKRKTELKFYEFLLHHTVAVTLILFSVLSNQIAAGSIILIVHDASDILLSLGRYYIQTSNMIKLVSNIMQAMLFVVWTWLRIIVFPVCLLANVYINRPSVNDEWYLISFEYNFLFSKAIILYGMHLFWTYFLIKIALKTVSGKKKPLINIHDKKYKVERE